MIQHRNPYSSKFNIDIIVVLGKFMNRIYDNAQNENNKSQCMQ
jgi:hypothetical protein